MGQSTIDIYDPAPSEPELNIGNICLIVVGMCYCIAIGLLVSFVIVLGILTLISVFYRYWSDHQHYLEKKREWLARWEKRNQKKDFPLDQEERDITACANCAQPKWCARCFERSLKFGVSEEGLFPYFEPKEDLSDEKLKQIRAWMNQSECVFHTEIIGCEGYGSRD